jgi:hypothetical protein
MRVQSGKINVTTLVYDMAKLDKIIGTSKIP